VSPVLVVDGHTHVWATWPYQPGVPDARTRGSVENLLLEMDANGVDHAVVVSAEIPGAEGNNDHGAEVVRRHPGRLSQLVDVDSHFGPSYHVPGAADRLRRVVDRYAPVGVSHYLAGEDDGWLTSDEGDRFLAAAEELGVVVNLAARPVWGPAVRAAARRHPGVTLLLNHLFTVMLHPGGLDEALRMVVDDEDLPNLVVKVSGWSYGTDRPWDYPFADRLAVVRRFQEAWGPDRMAWGSDWPSLIPHHSYAQGRHLLEEHADFLSAEDLAAIMGGTLARVLRLDAVVPV
jgi:predicted TIM-barrel fold metal-dependent hydrolase